MIILAILLRLIDVYSFILLIYALLSWFPGAYQTKVGRLLQSLVEPALNLFRKWPLQFGGLDFTIIVIWFLLQALSRLLISFL